MELKVRQRYALSTYFFLSGFCFSTWAARIPTIKTFFDLNEAQLGNVLLTLPICSMIGLPFSGWLVARYNSRVPLLVSFLLFAISLIFIGYAQSTVALISAIGSFAFCMRILNISMNTQAITLQKQYDKKINGAFHGIWSTGGIAGVGFSTLTLKLDIPMTQHLLMVAILTIVVSLLTFKFLLTNDKAPSGNKLILGKPDPFVFYLGLLVFFAAICEGGM
ncbi:MFS transporter [Arenibacter sp. 6A1]|uniref:MFS transporter n=1 Tax=Arenibacter sp. 6A1 TaxID=2720391 RepID=UPI001F109C9E|nr:MFS transporter [Arenibacter sp. 6A1]